VDGSAFYLREFVDVEIIPDRLMYAYQFIDSSQKLVFRYDNTGHHKKLGLSIYPHHKHDGVETRVIPSAVPDLATVFASLLKLLRTAPEMRYDPYRPKIFFGVQFPWPLRVAEYRGHQVWLGVA